MNKELEAVCVALDGLAQAVTAAWGADTTACENFGWFAPAITRHDLADLAKSLAADIRGTQADVLEQNTQKLVADLPHRIQVLQMNSVPQMFGGNGGQAIPAYVTTLQVLRATLLPSIGWQVIPDSKALPPSTCPQSSSSTSGA